MRRTFAKNRWVRVGGVGALSVAMTFTLFYVMQFLVSGGKDLKRPSAIENVIDFVRIKSPSNLEVRKRELPKKPEVQKEELKTQKLNLAKQDVAPKRPTQMKFDMPKLDIPLATGEGGMAVGSGGGAAQAGDSDEVPLVRVEPQFPQDAASRGITKGWVRLTLDLNTDGSVSQASVVDSSPRNVFEQSAVKSVLKWKYRPKVIDGKPVVRKGIKIQLDFALE